VHLWVYVSVELPLTAHALAHRARFSSAASGAWDDPEGRAAYEAGRLDHRPLIENPEPTWLSPYAGSATAPYRVELAAEAWRREHKPTAPSRLSAVFAFASPEDAHRANEKYGWCEPEDRLFRFRLLEHPLNRVLVANGEAIQCARAAYRQGMLDPATQARLWRHYFEDGRDFEVDLPVATGKQRCRYEYLPEVLVEGTIELDEPEGRPLPEAAGPIAPAFR
jgi:hypothetical protein